MTIGLDHCLSVVALLFLIGVVGVIANRRNVIAMLMSLELMLLEVILNFVVFSQATGNLTGQVFALIILAVAAAEAAIGLAILVVYFRNRGEIDVNKMTELQG